MPADLEHRVDRAEARADAALDGIANLSRQITDVHVDVKQVKNVQQAHGQRLAAVEKDVADVKAIVQAIAAHLGITGQG